MIKYTYHTAIAVRFIKFLKLIHEEYNNDDEERISRIEYKITEKAVCIP